MLLQCVHSEEEVEVVGGPESLLPRASTSFKDTCLVSACLMSACPVREHVGKHIRVCEETYTCREDRGNIYVGVLECVHSEEDVDVVGGPESLLPRASTSFKDASFLSACPVCMDVRACVRVFVCARGHYDTHRA